MEAHQRWFAEMLKAGIEQRLLGPSDILAHATPMMLAAHLPANLIAEVFQNALAAESMTPDVIFETLTPELLARYIPHQALWACIASGAERARFTEPHD